MRLRASLLALLLLAILPPAQAATGGPSPSDPRNFTWVEQGVMAVGGGGLTKDQVDWLHAQGFRAIADFRAEHEDPADHIRSKDMAFLDLPVDHAVFMNVSMLQRFVAWAKEQEAAGRPIYIHCTNGWHRAAAFSVAWEMERRGLSYDEAADIAEERRPGTVMRAPAPLLAYESVLTGKPGLTVMLLSPLSRPEWGGTMPVTVEVLAHGKPAAGAKVKVWSEESGMRLSGVTGEDGRFTFTYRAPPEGTPMDHLYARASLPGLLDGADNVELFYKLPVNPGAITIHTEPTPQGIALQVRKDGVPARAHVLASAPDGWLFQEMSARGRLLVPYTGEGAVTIRAERWGSEGATQVVEGVPPPKSEPAPKTEPKPEPQPTPPPRGVVVASENPPEPSYVPPPAFLRPVEGTTPGPAPAPAGSPVDALTARPWLGIGLAVVLVAGAGLAWSLRRRPTLA